MIAAVLATAVVGTALAGCGSDDGARATPASDTATAPTPPAPTPEPTSPAPTTPATTSPETTSTTPPSPTTTIVPPLFDFANPDAADGWNVTNDTVMGGVSSGELAWSDAVMVFTGELSLDNNGGFASIRSPRIDPQQAVTWANSVGLGLEIDGDGRTWTVEVRTDDDSGGWISPIATLPDGSTDEELPWASFVPVTRFLDPRETDERLDPSQIVTVAFYLVDGIEGPFRLGVRSIT